MPRSAVLLLPLLAFSLVATTKCSPPRGGFVFEAAYQSRVREYLKHATAEASTSSPLNAIAHMERDRTDPTYEPPVGFVDVGAWEEDFVQIRRYEDTRDFGALYILNAWLGYGPSEAVPDGHPYVTPAQWERAKQALQSFKMWYTDATPPAPDPTDPDCPFDPEDPHDPGLTPDGICPDWDNTFYWTENHQILFHTIQYLAGQRWPDECFVQARFTPTGFCDGVDANGRRFEYTGAEHEAMARPRVERWLEDRWDIGFAEWHSNIYYQKDVTPLLTLIEFVEDDPEIVVRAKIVLDQLLLDLAMHVHRDTFGVTAGRSTIKDSWFGPRNDTWGIAHLLFRQQDDLGYFSTGDPGATLIARARNYRMPRVVARVARHRETFIDRERHSVWIDETADAPDAPVPFVGPFHGDPDYQPNVPDANPLHGFDVDITNPGQPGDEGRFTFWWGLGAWTAWQVVPLTVATGDVYNLWNTNLLRDFRALRGLLGPFDAPAPPSSYGVGQSIALGLAPLATVGLLKEANTYTYRTSEYLLSTVQDYRKGRNVGQVRAWNLTIDANAAVYTQHPMNSLQPPSEWWNRDEGEPGYWSGSASMPRSAQHENVGIHIYSPVYSDGGLLGFFDYERMTHAWFPRDAFDEVVQEGAWTFGRKGDVFVALYSWRGTRWKEVPADELEILSRANPTLEYTQSFDLVADGPPPAEVVSPGLAERGPDNVWIVEVGTTSGFADFAAFRAAILAAPLEVVATPGPITLSGADLIHEFTVEWHSPSQGRVEFGWEGPLVVAGEIVPIHDYPRFDNPWIQMPRGADHAVMTAGPFEVRHDWAAPSREVVFSPWPDKAAPRVRRPAGAP